MELRNKIITAATDLFFRFGIKRITMDDISREMGISKKTLYTSFKDKDEIVDQLLEYSLCENVKNIDRINENAKDPIHELIESAKMMSSVFSRINPVFFYDLKRFYPSGWEKYQVFKEKNIMKIIENNLRRGVEMKIYRADLNIPVMTKFRVSQFDLALDPTIFPSDKFSLAETNALLLDHFMHGITTIKGHRLINKYKELKEDE
ncbi:MAG: TetR/AcrR family transcriptional regulator [Bacteroidia bacterium]|nr:TetR/AcrR family transcriptional regulator [Bacteroidia bacterium]